MSLAISGCLLVSAAGCASSPSSIKPSYVSANKYSSFTCSELNEELLAVGARVQEVSGDQKSAATADAVIMGVGLLVFWPSLFLLAATEDNKEELGRLKGEYDALKAAATEKRCKPVAPSKTVKASKS
ncbi:hypothetical protein [Pseudovibrio sp. Tun.PSC04-5.I4]|uniref:hypothetical protein n=1 Tax=Pseudovibrio sp. Tun.PSC04-5.I4 TaxID=1798213 RepID=UPI00089134FA|nr:hypothetical protein [Pseudovibrio sp. Tun.PSC04-5.I4]SDQ24691.1 hypothetical protein SAMN04515695_0650 [Pseudovibrio sp. Tun.PSC04-5.I4]